MTTRRTFRLLFVLLAICATLAIASVSVLPSHIHAKAPSTCELCVAAHSLACEIQVSPPSAPTTVDIGHAVTARALPAYQSVLPAPGLTRGPPSFTL